MTVEVLSSASRPALWKVWCLAARPKTLATAIAPVVVGTALAADAGKAQMSIAAAAAFGAVWIQIGTNLFNDYADFIHGADTETRIGPARATQRGWLRARDVLWAAALSFVVASFAGIYLLASAGWPVVVIGVASILSGLAYTGGPRPLAYTGLGDVFVFVFFGLVAVAGSYFVQTLTLTVEAFAAALPCGFLATAVLVVNNLRDRHTDALSNKKTLAVRFGERFARAEYGVLLGGAYTSVIITGAIGVHGPGWLVVLLSLPLAWKRIAAVRCLDGARLNPELGRTARLGLLFSVLLAVGIVL